MMIPEHQFLHFCDVLKRQKFSPTLRPLSNSLYRSNARVFGRAIQHFKEPRSSARLSILKCAKGKKLTGVNRRHADTNDALGLKR